MSAFSAGGKAIAPGEVGEVGCTFGSLVRAATAAAASSSCFTKSHHFARDVM